MDKKKKQLLVGRIHNAMYQNIQKKGFAAPVDVLIDLGVPSQKDYEDWRFGRVPFLEKVASYPGLCTKYGPTQ